MRLLRRLLPTALSALVLAGLVPAAAGFESKPNFGGAWKLDGTNPPEIYIVEQTESQLRVVMFVDNEGGARTLDVKGPTDGQPHEQEVNGAPCTFVARWEGDALYWETRRDTADGVRHNQRLMTLSADGKSISAQRTRLSPAPEETWTEKWEKQDPSRSPHNPNAFALRDLMDGLSAKDPEQLNGPNARLARGLLACYFDDLPSAKRELLPIIRKERTSTRAEQARAILGSVYQRNGQVRKALAACKPGECSFLEKLSKYPELSVAHRAYARVQATRDADGRILLPVTVAGKEARYQLDTGSNMSLLTLSEASRLGLKLEPVSMQITDVAGVVYEGHLTIVPSISVGRMRLKNAVFWVVEDARLSDPGLLGIDVLLKFQTLRWNSSGVFEVGFPPLEKNIREANLYLEGSYLVTEMSSGGKHALSSILDTGMSSTYLFAPFATRFLDLVAASGRQSAYEISGEAGRTRLRELVVPEVPLRIGGGDTRLHPAHVLLERAPLWADWHHGCIGIDVLNQARQVTLDFQAMRLTLEGVARGAVPR